MHSLYLSILMLALSASTSAADSESYMTCHAQSGKICCQSDISFPGARSRTYSTNQCCDGSISGKTDPSDPPSLLNSFRGMVCCDGDDRKGLDYGKPAATTCTSGVLRQMTDIAKEGGVTQELLSATSTGLAGMPTAHSGAGAIVAAAGLIALL